MSKPQIVLDYNVHTTVDTADQLVRTYSVLTMMQNCSCFTVCYMPEYQAVHKKTFTQTCLSVALEDGFTVGQYDPQF